MIIPDELYCFAYFPDMLSSLRELAAMAIPESWKFLKPQFQTVNQETPILERYLRNIYKHLAISYNNAASEEEKDQYICIRGAYACFNTGLQTTYFEGIFALFEINRKPHAKLNWIFKGFFNEVSSRLRYLSNLPIRPNSNTKAEPYHAEWEIRINYTHILQETSNRLRLPESIRSKKNAPLLLHASVLYGKALAQTDSSLVVPQLYCGRVQYLLPICLTDMSKCDLAMTLTPYDGFYLGNTCLTLEMAYHNARILNRPNTAWLAGLVDKGAARTSFCSEYIDGTNTI